MNSWPRNQHIAAFAGLTGGVLGIAAGLIQATVGEHIPNWSGHKTEPLALGLLTMLLSAISIVSAITLRRNLTLTAEQRLAAAAGLLIPGGLCFSTAGSLWYLPGVLLLTGGLYALVAGDPHRTREVVPARWGHLLVSVLGAFELLIAVSAGPITTIIVGVVGGVALLAAPWLPTWPVRLLLLLIGTLPFAVMAWWSVAAPVIAVLALAIGLSTLRRAVRRPPERAHVPVSAHS